MKIKQISTVVTLKYLLWVLTGYTAVVSGHSEGHQSAGQDGEMESSPLWQIFGGKQSRRISHTVTLSIFLLYCPKQCSSETSLDKYQVGKNVGFKITFRHFYLISVVETRKRRPNREWMMRDTGPDVSMISMKLHGMAICVHKCEMLVQPRRCCVVSPPLISDWTQYGNIWSYVSKSFIKIIIQFYTQVLKCMHMQMWGNNTSNVIDNSQAYVLVLPSLEKLINDIQWIG